MITIGIDPGITGAVAIINNDSDYIALHDTPCIAVKKSNGKIKNEYLPGGMAELLAPLAALHYTKKDTVEAFIEQVASAPGQGVASMFGFGKGYGIWLGILAAFKIPYSLVIPQRWKKELMLGKTDKDVARIRAQELFPQCCPQLNLKKHIGRADALLIAEYGRRTQR